MNKRLKQTFDKYAEPGGSIKNRDNLTLEQWKEFKETLDYFNQESKGNIDAWRQLTGNGRLYDCFIREVNHYISQLKNKSKPDKSKPTNLGDANINKRCEKCGASCTIYRNKTPYTVRKRYIKHKIDFTREKSIYFGTNCPCAEEYLKANQQICSQCKKREYPHMKKGWLLDYEIKKAFCSPLCNVTYREPKWEEAQKLTRVEMFPPELEVNNNNQPNFD